MLCFCTPLPVKCWVESFRWYVPHSHLYRMWQVVLYSLAMELLWLFSTLGRSSLGPLLSEHLLTLLTAYLDINHRFYQFSPFFTKKMESLCRSTRFLQQKVTTVPMTKEVRFCCLQNPNACFSETSLEMYICLWPDFDCPEMTLCGWYDIKIQLLQLNDQKSFILCGTKSLHFCGNKRVETYYL